MLRQKKPQFFIVATYPEKNYAINEFLLLNRWDNREYLKTNEDKKNKYNKKEY